MSDFLLDYVNSRPQSTLMIRYLLFLKKIGFKPRVIYDIGAYNGSWANIINEIFPDIRIILFDASMKNAKFYLDKEHHIVCLSNVEKEIDFYEIKDDDRVKSYYKPKTVSDEESYKLTTDTLNNIVNKYGLPLPDLVRIDCCGAEKDIIEGGEKIIKNAKYLITSLQNEELFIDGPLANITGPYIKSLGFDTKNVLDLFNTPIIDYVFENKNI
jgi:FkbM family methyltransferase